MGRKTRELAAKRNEERRKKSTRRAFLVGAGALGIAAASGYGFWKAVSGPPLPSGRVAEWDEGVLAADVVYGREDAPVTVYEFASMTCVHCARFHAESMPGFLREHVDTGRARLVYRHFPFDAAALAAARAVTCLPAGDRPGAISALFSSRQSWAGHPDPNEAVLARVGGGRASASLRACASDGDTEQQVLAAMATGRRAGVSSTPSFVVNGSLYAGFMSAEALGKIVEAAA